MGVYIPNMDMPKDCKECPFKTCFIRVNIKSYVCLINGSECEKTDCPLIEIADDVWKNEKYKLIRMTQAARFNKAMAERRTDDHI